MTPFGRALLNGAFALLVATGVAYAVGRDRNRAVATGCLSGALTFLSSWKAAEPDASVPAAE